ncbi:MAG: hypothetical protein A2186_03575 [Candidatus Levybacteria bacterium RIFOXYA1_FULL_41_10]|nr:MAG: hypothetical protein A3J18_02240 [Candidatus Levybacteria bacterium RIFCSPLOWO2_02_FULL_40_18]OGH53634.1 MAG: hypothetical protein A3H20_00995 [Candidatus Levybacteria bacterium RIFCSPLOWO2_12_FULL_41_12]OGH54383.1 MAG: hypothetical protein A2596_01525 [Candidatus Levybacteria bacterium RIFOXYD1_FULL_40_21]OGH55752.1 MAG: hypothetical protein A2423_01225 [Candidatus Levybacteria bacterium RIFOXYC1_FULL_40_10]OGH57514.1 MAG: hypothetical protein A2186_03575 [Candidatus Levybacteria bacte
MFPLVHIYAATTISKKKTHLLVIGSVLPDLVWVNRDKFPPQNLHDSLDDFYSYIEKNHKDMLDLALGMKLHSNEVGADKYSHFYKGGYSYVKGKELAPDLSKLVDSNSDKKMFDLSHNFMEAALDLNLLNDHPEIIDLYKDSLHGVDLRMISKVLSEYSNIDYELFFKTIQTLFDVVNPENLASEESISNFVLPKMIKLGFNQDVDDQKVLRILQKAVRISSKDYKELFSEMLAIMKKDFSEYN